MVGYWLNRDWFLQTIGSKRNKWCYNRDSQILINKKFIRIINDKGWNVKGIRN